MGNLNFSDGTKSFLPTPTIFDKPIINNTNLTTDHENNKMNLDSPIPIKPSTIKKRSIHSIFLSLLLLGNSKSTPKVIQTSNTTEPNTTDIILCQPITINNTQSEIVNSNSIPATIDMQPYKSSCNCTSSSRGQITVHIRSCPHYEVIILLNILYII